MEILQWELIKQKRPVQSVGASDLDTSSMILDNTSLDAPFFHHSSIPFLKTLWGKNDRIEHQLMEPMEPMETMEPIKTVSLSQTPIRLQAWIHNSIRCLRISGWIVERFR